MSTNCDYTHIWEKIGKSEKWICVILAQFEGFWEGLICFGFQQISRTRKFRWISSKIWNWRKNFIFKGLYIFDFLSDLHEKLTVRKVEFCCFWPLYSKIEESLIFVIFSNFSWITQFCRISRNLENFEIPFKITLFSKGCIFSNICRNSMKSWLWERSDSEVFK